MHLEAGKPAQLLVRIHARCRIERASARLVWSKVDLAPQPAAIDAAKNADVVVAVVGITSELGRRGDAGARARVQGRRPHQPRSAQAGRRPDRGARRYRQAAGGGADQRQRAGVNWAKEHANAILDAWYPGEEGGAAVAETLSGKNNPAGRLPVTFYTGVDQLPAFEDYSMKGRTYRYFEGKPLYPFGYGLSYTTFSYSGLESAAPSRSRPAIHLLPKLRSLTRASWRATKWCSSISASPT